MIRNERQLKPGVVSCITLAVFTLSLSSVGRAAVTAYWNYNSTTFPNTAADAGLHPRLPFFSDPNGIGSHTVDPNNGNFDGGLVCTPSAAQLWLPTVGQNNAKTVPGDEGTIEMWIAPTWNGTGQGGIGISDGEGSVAGDRQYLFFIGETSVQSPGIQITVMDTGEPGKAEQVIVFWNDDAGGSVELSNFGLGSAKNWVSGQWHHVAFCWDFGTLRLFLDGTLVSAVPRPSSSDSAHDIDTGFFLFGHIHTVGVEQDIVAFRAWDGKADDVIIWDNCRYTANFTPPGPLQAPATCQEAIDNGFGLKTDFNGDCAVDLVDFSLAAVNWLFNYAP